MKYVTGLIFTFLVILPVEAEECLSLASNPQKFKLVATFDKDVRKVFERAGVCAEYVHMPLKRMQHDITNSVIDGEYLRVQSYISKMKKHVVAIPTPAVAFNGFLVTLSKTGFSPKKLTDLKSKKIGIVHGAVWQVNASKNAGSIHKAYKYGILVRLLKKQEIDGFLIEELSLQDLILSKELSAKDIKISPPVITMQTYILLHKKHQKLVARLDAALNTVKEEGGFCSSGFNQHQAKK